MVHSRVEYTSGTQKLGNACGGLGIGVILFGFAVPLLIWNEGEVVMTTRSLDEGLAAVQAIDGGAIESANKNKLVHFSAPMEGEVVGDETLGVAVAGARLRREVEVRRRQ